MAAEELQGIIQALAGLHQRRQEAQRLQQQAEYQQAETENRKEQRRLEEQHYQEQERHQKMQEDAQAAAARLARYRTFQGIGEDYSKTGIAPPGVKATPIPGSDEDVMLQGQVAGEDIQTQTKTPEAYAKLRAHIDEITAAPKREHEFALKSMGDEDAYKRAVKLANMQEERADARNEVMKQIAAGHDAASRYHTDKMGAAGSDKLVDPNVGNHYISGFAAGDYSIDQLHQIFPDKINQTLVTKGMQGAGANYFTKEQREARTKFAYAASVEPDLEYVQRLLTRPVAVPKENGEVFVTDPKEALIPGTRTNMLVNVKRKQIAEGLIGSLPVFGQAGRISNVRAKAVVDALDPSIIPTADLANGEILKKFKSVVGDQFDATYDTLAPFQRKAMKAKYGISDWGGGLPKGEGKPPANRRPLTEFETQPAVQ